MSFLELRGMKELQAFARKYQIDVKKAEKISEELQLIF